MFFIFLRIDTDGICKLSSAMASNLESFLKRNIGYVLGGVAVIIVAVVALSVTDFEFLEDEDVSQWHDYVIGTWDFQDRDGGDMVFQFHPNGRYDFYLKLAPMGSGFGEWKVVDGSEELGIVSITPTEDPTQVANLYMKRIHIGAMDVRMGDIEGLEFTRFTRLENP